MKRLLFIVSCFLCCNAIAYDGIDLSHHNKIVSFVEISSKVKFAYLKATEGANFKDPCYEKYNTGLRREGVLTGAYLFYRAEYSPERNFNNFKQIKRDDDLIPMIDFETGFNLYSIKEHRKRIKKLVSLFIQEYGVNPIIYCTERTYIVYLKGNVDDCPIWIASRRKPNVNCLLWQDNSKLGYIKGIQGGVDINYFINGDIENLKTGNVTQVKKTTAKVNFYTKIYLIKRKICRFVKNLLY